MWAIVDEHGECLGKFETIAEAEEKYRRLVVLDYSALDETTILELRAEAAEWDCTLADGLDGW